MTDANSPMIGETQIDQAMRIRLDFNVAGSVEARVTHLSLIFFCFAYLGAAFGIDGYQNISLMAGGSLNGGKHGGIQLGLNAYGYCF